MQLCALCIKVLARHCVRDVCSRMAKHAGRSGRTGNIVVHPSYSSIRLRVESICDGDATEDMFEVLSSSTNNFDLRILESLYISKTLPKLNGNTAHHLRTSLMRDARTCVRVCCFRINYEFFLYLYFV